MPGNAAGHIGDSLRGTVPKGEETIATTSLPYLFDVTMAPFSSISDSIAIFDRSCCCCVINPYSCPKGFRDNKNAAPKGACLLLLAAVLVRRLKQ